MMKLEIERAIREALEAWETPDSPEAFAGAMYQLKQIYESHPRRQTPELRPETTRHAKDPAIGAHRAAPRQQAPNPLQAARNLSGRLGDGED
jgi:hypothetical protein